MSNVVIDVKGLGKAYQLGQFSTGTLANDVKRWWALSRGKEDPFLKIGEANDRSKKGDSDIVWSLKDISFDIKQGDSVGIIGRNGAGKSTLLKVLSHVTSPTTGVVKVKGRIASLLEVGTGFHPELTGRENIFLNGAILGMSKLEIKSKFDEIVDFSGVERYIDTPVKRYSSGMYVRLAFAVAAHLESEILIVDEVLAVGDAEFQKKCLGKMGHISKGEGRTVLFVSHNMSAVTNLCTQGIVLRNGQMEFNGSIQGAMQSYLQQFSESQTQVNYTPETGPGNESARLLMAKVSGAKKKDVLRINESLLLEFELAVNKQFSGECLDITYHLVDELGNLVFVATTDSHIDCKGKFKTAASCVIPPNLMNTGIYNISRLLLVRNKGQVLTEFNDIIQFELVEQEKQELGWRGQKEGIVKPDLKWVIS
ncbi:MAG: ABC transporter ATP-binding protein [Imperialibacter sp.]|uniref:ABC transporter ATP-binding protein n=1 Tax=Imperialibacter sp. TaxID=2038411 RepID=UPI0032EE78B0